MKLGWSRYDDVLKYSTKMISSDYDAVAVVRFLIFYGVSLYGLRVIRNAFKNTAKPFLICFIILNIIFTGTHFMSPTTYTWCVFVVALDVSRTRTCKEINHHLSFLVYSSSLILHTVWCAIPENIFYELETKSANRYLDWLPLCFNLPFYIFLPIYSRDSSSLSLYWPVMVDILDGVHMTEKQLDLARNPVWMQTLICLAVFMCYIPSLYEIYHLRFPELS